MSTIDTCKAIANHVAQQEMPSAIMTLLSAKNIKQEGTDTRDTKPTLRVDLSGEDGNIYWLICYAIHALMQVQREASATRILAEYKQHRDYESAVAFLNHYVTIEDTSV